MSGYKQAPQFQDEINFYFLSSRLQRCFFGDHRVFLVSSEPLGPVFDPEAQTRRELVAERLNVDDWASVVSYCSPVFHRTFDSTTDKKHFFILLRKDVTNIKIKNQHQVWQVPVFVRFSTTVHNLTDLERSDSESCYFVIF